MRPLPPGKYGVIHEIEVKGHELDALAKKLGIEKPSRLRAGKIQSSSRRRTRSARRVPRVCCASWAWR
jgi:hypothetical protein